MVHPKRKKSKTDEIPKPLEQNLHSQETGNPLASKIIPKRTSYSSDEGEEHSDGNAADTDDSSDDRMNQKTEKSKTDEIQKSLEQNFNSQDTGIPFVTK